MPNLKSKLQNFNNYRYGYQNTAINNRLAIIKDLIDPNGYLLDLGCGRGHFLKYLGPQYRSLGYDISTTSIKHCLSKKINAKVVNLEESFPDSANTFDTIVAGEIIEHIFDTDSFLSEIKRVLKPNGSLILSTPNLASLGRRLLLMIGRNPLIEDSLGPQNAGHVRYFTFPLLKQLLTRHGFEIEIHKTDQINFDNQGRHFSTFLSNLFPKLGASIILKCKNTK